MPPTRPRDTRRDLFEAGLILIEKRGMPAVTLAAVAAAARVTRQTVYLHFGSRAGFLLALGDYLNEREGFVNTIELVQSASSCDAALLALIDLRIATAVRLGPLILATNAAMTEDEAAAEVWARRQAFRLRPYRALARRMRAERLLRTGITPTDAAALMWATLSFETWNYLVLTLGWSDRKYRSQMRSLIRAALFMTASTGRRGW